jgi:hypothetical protein
MNTEWPLRIAGAALVDWPPIIAPQRSANTCPTRWVRTLWPEPANPGGWAAWDWQPAPRGWIVPAELTIGDVIEFGMAWLEPDGTAHPRSTARWYGWLRLFTPHAIVVQGPYCFPADAARGAQPMVDQIRLSHLPGPGLDLAEPSHDQDW